MTDKFKVGDRVRIIKGIRIGKEAIILSPREHWFYKETTSSTSEFLYQVDVEGEGCRSKTSGLLIGYTQNYLAPLYDGYEKTTWDQCVWRPKVLEKV